MTNTIDNYHIVIYPRAFRDIEKIYFYISRELLKPLVAKRQTNRIWHAIESLSSMPFSHQERQIGRYANKSYRQLLIDNYIVIYKIDTLKRTVAVVTVVYNGKNS